MRKIYSKSIYAAAACFIFIISSSFIQGDSPCDKMDLMKEGSVYTLTTFSADEDTQGVTVCTSGKRRFSATGMETNYTMSTAFAGDTIKVDKDFSMICNKGFYYIDIKAVLPPSVLRGYERLKTVHYSGRLSYSLEESLQGALPDAQQNIRIFDMENEMANITIKFINRIAGGKEEIKTSAGAYMTYIVTGDMHISTSMLGMEMPAKKYKLRQWFSATRGIVRSEMLDTEGKLINYTVLTNLAAK